MDLLCPNEFLFFNIKLEKAQKVVLPDQSRIPLLVYFLFLVYMIFLFWLNKYT